MLSMSALQQEKEQHRMDTPTRSFDTATFTHHDLQRLHRRATHLISSASGTSTTTSFNLSTSNNNNNFNSLSSNLTQRSLHSLHKQYPLTTPGGPAASSMAATSSKPTPALLTSLQRVVDDMRDSLQQSLVERKQLHADALELAEAESKDLYDSVIAAQLRASTAEEQLAGAKAKLEEYRENASSRFSSELSELKQDWSNQMSATVMQGELRAALEKTRSVAEEQALRLKVLTDERSRMIRESTAERRRHEESEKNWTIKWEKNIKLQTERQKVWKDETATLQQDLREEKKQHAHAKAKVQTLTQHLKQSRADVQEQKIVSKRCQEDVESTRKLLETESQRTRTAEMKMGKFEEQCSALSARLEKSARQNILLESKITDSQDELKNERLSLRNIMEGVKNQSNEETERLVQEAVNNATAEAERRIREQATLTESALKIQLHEKEKSLEATKKSVQDLQRLLEVEREKSSDSMSEKETYERKLHHIETMLKGEKEEIKKLEKVVEDMEKMHKKEMESIKTQHQLMLNAKVAEATSTTKRSEEKRTRSILEDMQKKMDTNLLEIQEHRSTVDKAQREAVAARGETQLLSRRLADAQSEIEENQRAVLETLKLSSEIQQSETELKGSLERERGGHSKTKSELEVITSKLSRIEMELERMKVQREEAETERSKWRQTGESAEVEARRATVDLEMLRRKHDELERDYQRAFENLKELTNQVSEHRHSSRAKNDQIDKLERNLRELTLDTERERNHRQTSETESQRRVQEADRMHREASLELSASEAACQQKMSEIERFKVQIAMLETAVIKLEEEYEEAKNEANAMTLQVEDTTRREQSLRKILDEKGDELRDSRVEVATLEERCRTFDARMNAEDERHKHSLEREEQLRQDVETALQRMGKENVLLRKRHDMLALERDRAHSGYTALRKQTERLQNAAREAARKAQIAALTVQRQMMNHGSFMKTSAKGGQSSSSEQQAFDAAEDLSWVAIGGTNHRPDAGPLTERKRTVQTSLMMDSGIDSGSVSEKEEESKSTNEIRIDSKPKEMVVADL